MSTISLDLPASIQRHIDEIAANEGVSISQFITTAVVEKVSAITTEDYLQARAAKADLGVFRDILAKTPSREPLEGDEL